MKDELQPALALARSLELAELPRLLGDLAEISAVATARLVRPAIETRPDESLTVEQASKRLGLSKSYLHHNWKTFKFARQEGRKILFSSKGLDAHIRKPR